MPRRLDLGIASYGASNKLRKMLDALLSRSITDLRIFVIDNPGPDSATRDMICQYRDRTGKVVPVFLDVNVGYAGAVNKLFELAETEYFAYCDNDAYVQTPSWDEVLCGHLDRFHEIGMIFPGGGIAPIERPGYRETMWGIGYCWMVSRMCQRAVGAFDAEIGHQEEADYAMRVRMAGWKCAAAPMIDVRHDASASANPAQQERINAGVVRFVTKWNRYFNGQEFHYHHPRVTRWEDWPPNALYLEDYWQKHLPGLNANPESLHWQGRDYDLIRVPRYSGFYRGRVI